MTEARFDGGVAPCVSFENCPALKTLGYSQKKGCLAIKQNSAVAKPPLLVCQSPIPDHHPPPKRQRPTYFFFGSAEGFGRGELILSGGGGAFTPGVGDGFFSAINEARSFSTPSTVAFVKT